QLIVLTPVFLLQLAIPETVTGVPTGGQVSPLVMLGGVLGGVLVTIGLAPMVSGSPVHVMAQEFIDQRVTLAQAMQFGVRRVGQPPFQILLPSVEWVTADGTPTAAPFGIPPATGARPVLNYTHFVIGLVAIHLVNVLVQTFAYICWTLLYFDLRIRKEGFDL